MFCKLLALLEYIFQCLQPFRDTCLIILVKKIITVRFYFIFAFNFRKKKNHWIQNPHQFKIVHNKSVETGLNQFRVISITPVYLVVEDVTIPESLKTGRFDKICFISLDWGIEMIIFQSILTTFTASVIFRGRWKSSKNWIELKIVPLSANLACLNRWNTL